LQRDADIFPCLLSNVAVIGRNRKRDQNVATRLRRFIEYRCRRQQQQQQQMDLFIDAAVPAAADAKIVRVYETRIHAKVARDRVASRMRRAVRRWLIRRRGTTQTLNYHRCQ
jgi:hypothetical protein